MNTIEEARKAAGIPLPSDANVVGLALSRTNLETLLAKLDDPSSVRTLVREIVSATDESPATILVLRAEEDAEHYHSADRQDIVRGERGKMAEEGATWPGEGVRVPAETSLRPRPGESAEDTVNRVIRAVQPAEDSPECGA